MGVTSDLERRVWEHKSGDGSGFSKRYKTKMPVYYEMHGDMDTAIAREKEIKKYRRAWKIHLIEGMNPNWRDLLFENPFSAS